MKVRVTALAIGFALILQLITASTPGYAYQGSELGKWSGLLERFEAPLNSSASASSGIAAWKASLQRLEKLSAEDQIRGVNDLLNKVPYLDDQRHYGLNGYWAATPERFFKTGGDCKDYALAKYASLRRLGFSPEKLRISVVVDKIKKAHHAILIVNDTYVLDNQAKDIGRVTEITRYQPIYTLNSKGWWKGFGPLKTRRMS